MAAREAVAYHEAGHAVAAIALGRPFDMVTVVPKDGALGYVQRSRTAKVKPVPTMGPHARTRVEQEIMIDCAGAVAEVHFLGRRVRLLNHADVQNTVDLAAAISGSPEEAKALVAWLWERTRTLLTVPARWEQVKRLAAALLQKKTLSYAETVKAIESE